MGLHVVTNYVCVMKVDCKYAIACLFHILCAHRRRRKARRVCGDTVHIHIRLHNCGYGICYIVLLIVVADDDEHDKCVTHGPYLALQHRIEFLFIIYISCYIMLLIIANNHEHNVCVDIIYK